MLAVAALFCATSPLFGQSAEVYLQAARRYRDAPASAVRTVARMARRDISDGITACLTTRCGPRDLIAYAVMHADVVESVLGSDANLARFHVRSGARLLDPLRHDAIREMQKEALAEGWKLYRATGVDGTVVPRWYALVARLYLAHHYVAEARSTITEGLSKGGDSPDLYLTRGLTTELPLFWDFPDLRGTLADRARVFGNADRPPLDAVLKALQAAALDYRHALMLQPSHTPARLRLGWVRLLEQDPRGWEDLATAIEDAADSETLYLAHLLRGLATARGRSAGDAIADYEAAERVLPEAQTACVALSHAYEEAARLPEAQRLANRCLPRTAGSEIADPWWVFRLGLPDPATVRWLHEEARRP